MGEPNREEINEDSLTSQPKNDILKLQVAIICRDSMQVDNALCDLTRPGKFDWPIDGRFVVNVQHACIWMYFERDILEVPGVHVQHQESTNGAILVDYYGLDVDNIQRVA